ncbi:MAG: ABC transporter ATP-binding protein [Acidobacteria bacterium]|nr:ABC transporter ATP-binding protein [Acidobacteriota bacterium]
MIDPEDLVRLESVTKTYGEEPVVYALNDFNLEIKRGERIAVMGPSGSGKSTLLNLICGLDTPTAGSVSFGGIELSKLSDDDCTRLRRKKIGMIFQSFNLLPTLTALENVSLPLRLQSRSRREAETQASAMLARVGLQERLAHRPDEMSGGERQRTAIARALIFEPLLLLADEPTGNLDSTTGEEILCLLDQLHRERGMTILLVTHNELAAAHCERQLTLRDGRVVRDERRARAALQMAQEVV